MAAFHSFKVSCFFVTIITFTAPFISAAEFAGGTGEPNNPFQIATAEQLISIGSDPNLLDKCFVLINDIDLDPNLLGGQVFNKAVIAPDVNDKIGFQGTAFTGCFDGNGHRIRNLTIYADTKDNLGLFGVIGIGGKVQNLRVEDASIGGAIGTWSRGGLAGANGGSIKNCCASGNLIGSYYIGGLAGTNNGDIRGCYASGKVTGSDSLGGLVGENYTMGKIVNSYAFVTVSSKQIGLDLGGLLGRNYGGTIVKCYAVGTVFNAFIEDSYKGGFVGFNLHLLYGAIIDCFWNAEISGIYMSDGGKGLTTAQMIDPNIYSLNGWAGDPNWVLDAGKDYPRLAWERKAGQTIPEPNIDWFDGRGTQEDPFIIATVNQFARIGTASILWDKSFVLVSDLDLTGMDFSRIGVCPGTDFNGTFDGRNHTINNLTTGSNLIPASYFGLFGYIGPGGCVRCLTVKSTTIKCGLGSEKVGILAGVNQGAITDCCVTGSVSIGYYWIGGLAGENQGRIANCYSEASVSGGNYSHYLGGLVGCNYSQISNCYAKGSVTGGDNSNSIGGLIGEQISGSIINCYATTSVSSGDRSLNLGGLVGHRAGFSPDIVNCFWDIQTSGLSRSFGGTGLTTAEMQAAATFINAGWDFENVWMICEGKDYPRLRWQNVWCEE